MDNNQILYTIYFNLTKCKFSRNSLTLYVSKEIYNAIKNIIEPQITSRKKFLVLANTLKLFFFIRWNIFLKYQQITQDILCEAINLKTPRELLKYLEIITENLYISKSTNVSYTTFDTGDTIFSKYNSYDVSKIIEASFLQDIPEASSYIPIKYTITNKTYKILVQRCLEYNKNLNIPAKILLPEIKMQAKPMEPQKLYTNEEYFQIFLKTYNRLTYINLIGDIDIPQTISLVTSQAEMKDDNRIYHRFHNLDKDLRETHIYLDGEPLVEAMDIHNARWICMNAILPDDISLAERNRFYRSTTSGKFYEIIADWINKKYETDGWDRNLVKHQINIYLQNMKKPDESIECIDKYFIENFPNIRNFINNFSTEKEISYRTSWSSKKGEFVSRKHTKNIRRIYKPLNDVETHIMIFCICKDLYEKCGINAITLHDGIFMKESDYKKLKDENIGVEKMFLEYLNAYIFVK